MTDSRYTNTIGVQVPPTETMRRFGLMVALVGFVALIVAFVPVATIGSLLVGLLGLALGISCLVLDRSFNVFALVGTIVSSAAVSLAIIMGLVYGA